MKYDASALRKSSEVPRFPYDDRRVTFIWITTTGSVSQASTLTDKRIALRSLGKGDLLLGAWPGDRRQDIFVIDDLAAAEYESVQR